MAGAYVSFILTHLDSGTQPGVLAVLSPHTELVINTKTATDLIAVPAMLLARAVDLIT